MDLVIKPEGHQTRLIATFYQKGKETLRFATVIQGTTGKGLWNWTRGTFDFAQLSVSDLSFIRAITDYYRATNRPIPQDLQKSAQSRAPFETVIRLNAPMPVGGLLKRF